MPRTPVGLEPVDPRDHETVSTEVARRLATYLLEGNVEPGARIPSERRLAEVFGVGRFVVREAVKTLATLGILDVRQGDGTYFRRRVDATLLSTVLEWGLLLDPSGIQDLIEARRLIEVAVAGFAAERRDAQALAGMQAAVTRMQAAGSDADQFVAADIDFHLLIADAAGNGTLNQVMANVRSMLQAWITQVVQGAPDYEPFLSEHLEILAAIDGGDAEAARIAMGRHMDSTASRLLGRVPAADDDGYQTT